MPAPLRTFLIVALVLPALLLPRGMTLTMCLCGSGLGSSLCTITCAVDGPVTCCCTPTAHELATSCKGGECGEDGERAAHADGERCPGCHLVEVSEAPIDWVAAASAPVAPPPDVLAIALVPERTAPAFQGAASPVGRAPPGSVVATGRRPGVLPLRI